MKEIIQLSRALRSLGYSELSKTILKIGQQTTGSKLQKIEISSTKIFADSNDKDSAAKGYKLSIVPINNGVKGQPQTIDYLFEGGVKLLPQGGKNPQVILTNIIGNNSITPGMFSLNLMDGKTNFDFGLKLE
jgi:hypothetical protein